MPGKSKHGKGRRTQYKNRARQPQTAGTVNSAPAAPAAAVPAGVNQEAAATVKPVATVTKAQGYKPGTVAEVPFLVRDLKKIGLLTLIAVVIIVILAFIIK
jgi:hypothetical protein